MKSATTKAIILILLFWMLQAFFNIGYNTTKSVSEIREWVFLTDSQKRRRIFSDAYDFPMFIKDNTSNTDTVVLINVSDMLYSYSRYILYPQKIIWMTEKNKNVITQASARYVATYNTELINPQYERINSYFSPTSGNVGYLYKRK